MGKLILTGMAVLFSFGAIAQPDTTVPMKSESYQTDRDGDRLIPDISNADISMTDGVLMKEGKVMYIHHGKMTLLDKEITMSNGTRVRRNGTFWDKDGIKCSMKMGDHIDLSGTLVSAIHSTVNQVIR